MQIGRLLGVKIIFNWFFFFMLIFYAVVGRLTETIILFLVVFLHEFSHIAAARGYGLTVREVELMPFGGIARIDDLLEYDPGIESRVALAGPLFNFLMVGIAVITYTNFNVFKEPLLFFIRANLMIAFFNLIPSLPLDGGRILRANLTKRFGYRRATYQAALLGKIFAVILLIIGGVSSYYKYFNLSLVLAALFMFYAAHKEQSMAAYVFVRYLARKHRELDRKGILKAACLVVFEDTPLKEIIKNFTPQNYHLIIVLTAGLEITGTVTEGEIIDAVLKRGVHLPIKRLIK